MKRERQCFRCPKCDLGFQRLLRATRQQVSCPSCSTRFAKSARITDEAMVAEILKECVTRRRLRNGRALERLPKDDTVIRVDQVPYSSAEAAFKARAIEKGWKPHRPSWPDYLVETQNGLMFVEVKSAHDDISETQARTLSLLERHGIPVYLWRRKKGSSNVLVKWNSGLGLVRVGLAS